MRLEKINHKDFLLDAFTRFPEGALDVLLALRNGPENMTRLAVKIKLGKDKLSLMSQIMLPLEILDLVSVKIRGQAKEYSLTEKGVAFLELLHDKKLIQLEDVKYEYNITNENLQLFEFNDVKYEITSESLKLFDEPILPRVLPLIYRTKSNTLSKLAQQLDGDIEKLEELLSALRDLNIIQKRINQGKEKRYEEYYLTDVGIDFMSCINGIGKGNFYKSYLMETEPDLYQFFQNPSQTPLDEIQIKIKLAEKIGLVERQGEKYKLSDVGRTVFLS